MSGHSKWANIKHRKGRQDKMRSKVWSKCSRAIIVAAKNGGGDPDMNLSLRYAIDEAKAVNMPKDTIEKAIKKGAGAGADAENYTPVRYEGYGPGGVAVIVDCLTDNLNRTAPEIRTVFDKHHGKLGVSGSVAFSFMQTSVMTLSREDNQRLTEEQVFETAVEAGADDVQSSPEGWEIHTSPQMHHAVLKALSDAHLSISSAEVTMLPQNTVACQGEEARKILRLLESFEELDDVQKVYSNADLDEASIAEID